MKYFNNYLYFTDVSVQYFDNFGPHRLIFKYGKGSSKLFNKNNRTEKRLNLNKPHPRFEKTYFFQTQKECIEIEDFTLKMLMKNKRYINIKNTRTQKSSEFFWVEEICKTNEDKYKIWYELSNFIEKIHYDYIKIDTENNERNKKELFETDDEDMFTDDEDMFTDDEDIDDLIDYKDFDNKKHTLIGSKIESKFNNKIYSDYMNLLKNIFLYLHDHHNDYFKSLIYIKKYTEELKAKKNYYEIINDYCSYHMNADNSFKIICKIIRENNLENIFEMKIKLKS